MRPMETLVVDVLTGSWRYLHYGQEASPSERPIIARANCGKAIANFTIDDFISEAKAVNWERVRSLGQKFVDLSINGYERTQLFSMKSYIMSLYSTWTAPQKAIADLVLVDTQAWLDWTELVFEYQTGIKEGIEAKVTLENAYQQIGADYGTLSATKPTKTVYQITQEYMNLP